MFKRLALISIILLIMTACGGPKEITIDINATSDGSALSEAVVNIDGNEVGKTDTSGKFNTMIERKYGSDINISVSKDIEGHHVTKWEETINFGEESEREFKYAPDIEIKPYVRFEVTDGKKPVSKAIVRAGKKQIGQTDENGIFEYEYDPTSNKKVKLRVSKRGYESWRKSIAYEPGKTEKPVLHRLLSINVKAYTEAYGSRQSLKGISVYLNDKHIGTTDKNGNVSFSKRGKNKKGNLVLSSQGFMPSRWETKIDLIGSTKITRYFYPVKASPVRISINRFTSNTGDEDIGDIPVRFHKEITSRFSKSSSFVVVPQDDVTAAVQQAKLTFDTMTSKGWKKTPVYKLVDAVAFGSVARDPSGDYILELSVYDADGKLASSQIVNARNSGKISRAAKQAIISLDESYPVTGRVIAKAGDDIKVNLGTSIFDINKNDELDVLNPTFDKNGKITKYSALGELKVTSTSGSRASAAPLTGKSGSVKIAAIVKRKTTNSISAKEYSEVFVQGGSSSIAPVAGANVYLDGVWLGNTDRKGIAKVPAKVGKEYKLRIYKHGFAQVDDKLMIGASGERKEITLDAYQTLAYIESEPSGATVFVDNQKIGNTPLDGANIPRGFRNIRISAGNNLRDYEEIIEVSGEELNWRGDNMVVLHQDFLKMGLAAENSSNFDKAIELYSKAQEDHPDYVDIKAQLAALYIDEKNNADMAVKEMESAMKQRDVKHLIYKRYAVLYTNMGHIYHEKANSILHKDKSNAIKYLASAIKSLKTARKNSRFFPSEQFDVVSHDTNYYLALSYHKLYQLTGKGSILTQARQAWQNYFDFFPVALASNGQYKESMEAAERYMEQLKRDN